MNNLVKGLMGHLGELAGAAAVSVGCGLIYLPAGLIAGGALTIIGSVLSMWGGDEK